MSRVKRVDLGSLASPVRRPDGTMIVDARITRTGVFVYRKADGSEFKEYRPSAEVFRANSRETFLGRPVTVDHPPVMVTARNARQFAVGTVLDVPRQDGIYLATKLSIIDAAAIAAIEAGKSQLSCGYECELDMVPGISPEGERYDAVQRDIVGNHLAIVDNARAGSGAHIRLDSEMNVTDEDLNAKERGNLPDSDFAVPSRKALPINDPAHCRAAMARFNQTQFASAAEKSAAYHRILAKAKEFGIESTGFQQAHSGMLDSMQVVRQTIGMDANEALKALEAQRADAEARASTLSAERDTHKLRADTAEGQLIEVRKALEDANAQLAGTQKAIETEAITREAQRADAAEAKVAQFDATFDARVKARVSLERKAAIVMGSDFNMDSLSDREVMASVIRKYDSSAALGAEVADGVIQGRFLSLTERHAATARQIAQVAAVQSDAGKALSKEDAKRARRDAWMQPLPNALK